MGSELSITYSLVEHPFNPRDVFPWPFTFALSTLVDQLAALKAALARAQAPVAAIPAIPAIPVAPAIPAIPVAPAAAPAPSAQPDEPAVAPRPSPSRLTFAEVRGSRHLSVRVICSESERRRGKGGGG